MSDAQAVDALRECPFCGEQLICASEYHEGWHEISCPTCGAEIGNESLQEAIRMWNRRTPAPLSAQSVANRHAYDHVPTVDEYTRNILESMVDDWLRRYEPGAMEWSDAQVIRAWLDNYSGTFYADAHRTTARGEGGL